MLHTHTRASLALSPSNLWNRNSVEIQAHPLPSPPFASGLLLLISLQASESSSERPGRQRAFLAAFSCVSSPRLSLIAALTHLHRPQSGQINNVGASIPPATAVIGWKCGCCSAWPVSLSNQIVQMHARTHARTHTGPIIKTHVSKLEMQADV